MAAIEKTEALHPLPPSSARVWIIVGAVCVLATIGGFGTWAAIAPLASAVVASATIRVDGKRKKIQHLEGGIIRELRVRDGDRVKVGDVLVRLESIRVRASLSIVKGSLDATRALEARLRAERDGDMSVSFSKSLLDRARQPEVGQIIKGQTALFRIRRAALGGEVAILRQRIIQLGEQIVGLHAQTRSTDRQIKIIGEELTVLSKLFKRGHTTKRRILVLQREAERLAGERGRLVADIAKSKTAIGETQLKILQIRKKFRQQVVAELRETQTRIHDLRERLAAAAEVVKRIEIRAPVAGTVVGLSVHTLGAVVKPGATVLEIVPIRERLNVEAKISPIDIDNIAVGHKAEINFTAFKQRDTPTITGRVTYTSADSLIDKRSGQAYFLARIAISPTELKRLGAKRLQPGMPAEVMILTGRRTALRYLAQPILDGMNRAWREE